MPQNKKLIRYSSNNSGGRWWLSDDDWKRLEQNDWKVEWVSKNDKFRTADKDGRWLGALATACSKRFHSLLEAAAEFGRITGQSASEAGCPCCGPPHYFSEELEDGVD